MTATVQITMLGGSGVGKTSLLTSMYEQFNATVGVTNLQLTPDLESSAILSDRLAELKSLLEDFEATAGQGILKTAQKRLFQFDIGQSGRRPSLSLQFVDYLGEWIDADATPEEKLQVLNLLRESRVVLVAIDAAALMEENRRWNEKINRTQQVTDLFKRAYQGVYEPRMVLLAPVKCEKYLSHEQAAAELQETIKKEYRSLLNFLASGVLKEKVAVVITPVQTVGSVIFSRIEVRNREPHFFFRKVRYDSVYSPKDSDQPLRYLLRFLLSMHYRRFGRWLLFDFLREWFGVGHYLREAIEEFARGCKESQGFEVVQGRELLSLDHQ
ncbi:MAG: hypothetical protein HC884_02865 [Chloroflexaceae bacterium]|nr:hypothetical protein [Chloroflexaceae bacterium]